MMTDRLARHYDSLTPEERFRLIMAAWVRGDEQERDRLDTSAPCLTYRLPHHFGLGAAFREVREVHRTEVLTLATWYLYGINAAGATGGEEGEELLDVSQWFGYLLAVNLEGWRQFCEGLGLDLGPLMACPSGQAVLDEAARLAGGRAGFTAEEALACMLRHGLEATAAPSAEGVAAGLRKAFDVRADWWGG